MAEGGAAAAVQGRRGASPGRGALIANLAEMPARPIVGVVLANELLDNLPTDIYERRSSRWYSVRVAPGSGGRLEEVLIQVGDDDPAFIRSMGRYT